MGAAITGMRPVVEVLFVDFTLLTMDQVVNQAAKYRLMSGGKGSVPLVLRTQGGVGDSVAAQHSQSLEALFYHIPGLKVAMPSTPYDAKGLLTSAIRDDDPVIFIEHKLLYMTEGPVPEEEYAIDLGVADIKRAGRDCTLIAWSNMVPRSLEAAGRLAAEGIEVEVIDPRSLVPLDREAILESVRRTEHVVIVQEAVRRGGVASDIASHHPGQGPSTTSTPRWRSWPGATRRSPSAATSSRPASRRWTTSSPPCAAPCTHDPRAHAPGGREPDHRRAAGVVQGRGRAPVAGGRDRRGRVGEGRLRGRGRGGRGAAAPGRGRRRAGPGPGADRLDR